MSWTLQGHSRDTFWTQSAPEILCWTLSRTLQTRRGPKTPARVRNVSKVRALEDSKRWSGKWCMRGGWAEGMHRDQASGTIRTRSLQQWGLSSLGALLEWPKPCTSFKQQPEGPLTEYPSTQESHHDNGRPFNYCSSRQDQAL